MRQIRNVVAGVLMFSFIAVASAWAKGPAGVANTIHNLSSSNPTFTYVSNTSEVCVFCHTPHGGSLDGPLWNRNVPGSTSFTHYNSASLSLSGLSITADRAVNDESLLCMSCHDGSIALSALHNVPNSLSGQPLEINGGATDEILAQGAIPGPRIGGSLADPSGTGDLSDDHPISFSYSAVVAQGIYQVGGSRDGELRHIGDTADASSVLGWQGEGVRLFGTDDRVECSSCHDPHVDYDDWVSVSADPAYRPFLIRPNNGSNLCLACHNK